MIEFAACTQAESLDSFLLVTIILRSVSIEAKIINMFVGSTAFKYSVRFRFSGILGRFNGFGIGEENT